MNSMAMTFQIPWYLSVSQPLASLNKITQPQLEQSCITLKENTRLQIADRRVQLNSSEWLNIFSVQEPFNNQETYVQAGTTVQLPHQSFNQETFRT